MRMDAKTSRPFLRSGFKIQDLRAWAAEHRGELLAALLTLAHAWYVAGRPPSKAPLLGSYESWSTTIGGVLAHAGVEGFLGNADDLYQEADADAVQWGAFLQTLHEVFCGETFTVAQVVEKLKAKAWDESRHICELTESAAKLKGALPDYLAEVAFSSVQGPSGPPKESYRRSYCLFL